MNSRLVTVAFLLLIGSTRSLKEPTNGSSHPGGDDWILGEVSHLKVEYMWDMSQNWGFPGCLYWSGSWSRARSYPPGNEHIPRKWHFKDDFPIPKVGYVNSLEGNVFVGVPRVDTDTHSFLQSKTCCSFWVIALTPNPPIILLVASDNLKFLQNALGPTTPWNKHFLPYQTGCKEKTIPFHCADGIFENSCQFAKVSWYCRQPQKK